MQTFELSVTVQPGPCIHYTDRMKTQSLRASGPSRSDFQWPDTVTVQWAELLQLSRDIIKEAENNKQNIKKMLLKALHC